MERARKEHDSHQSGTSRRVAQAGSSRNSRQKYPASGIDGSPLMIAQRRKLQSLFGGAAQLQDEPISKPNNTGLPDNLKSGIESLSGMSMDHVKVHYNSSKPAQLNALAYAQGSDIHVAPGQEKHLPHEAWHVVQQAEGRVNPTMQMKGGVAVNDDKGLEQEADAMGARALAEGHSHSLEAARTARGGGYLSIAGGNNVVQREEFERLEFTPTLVGRVQGGAESGVAGNGTWWAVNLPNFIADLDYEIRGASRDVNGLEVGLVQNACDEWFSAIYQSEDGNRMRVEFEPLPELPLLDAGESTVPYYDDMSRFKLIRANNDTGIEERITDEVQIQDRLNFALPYVMTDPYGRSYTMMPDELFGERKLEIWIRVVDKSGDVFFLEGLKWSMVETGAISFALGNSVQIPHELGGPLASTSNPAVKSMTILQG